LLPYDRHGIQTFDFFSGTTLVVVSAYLSGSAIFTFMDLTLVPNGLRKYKNQPGKNEPLDFNKIWGKVSKT